MEPANWRYSCDRSLCVTFLRGRVAGPFPIRVLMTHSLRQGRRILPWNSPRRPARSAPTRPATAVGPWTSASSDSCSPSVSNAGQASGSEWVSVTRASLVMTQATGCRQVPSRCPARRARCGPLAGCCRARPGARAFRRAAGRRSRRHEPPIRRQARARPSRTEAAGEAATACCTRRTTTLRRLAPASSSASSDVGWTTELRSRAGPFLVMPSFACLPA